MFIKVTRSQAITSLLAGEVVFCGDAHDTAGTWGCQLEHPEHYSRRKAARALTRFFYNDAFYPRATKIEYWIHQ